MILPRLGVPDWTITFIMILLGLGFPIAIGLAWTFQLTPEGLKRSPKTGEKQSPDHKPFTGNAIIITLLTLILGFTAYPRFFDSSSMDMSQSELAALDEKSVAVLPFTPFADEREDEIFADGVHDDILTQLSKIADLKVISRTSVMQYKGTTKLIPAIARELGVANILEGSVRRAGDQVRIVAQLINARTDEHLWAETFDRKYADIFSVQTEVSKKIASALKAKLTPAEEQYIETRYTENQEAWDVYLRADLLRTSGVADDDSLFAMYERATELDPDFLLPYTILTRGHAQKYFDGSGTDPTPARLKKAEMVLEKALAINAEAPETHQARGFFYYYGSRDYQKALEEFSIAQESQPNNSDLFAATAYVERRLGLYEQATENLQKAVSLDPNDGSKVWEARNWAFFLRDWDLAQRYQEQLSAIYRGKEASQEFGRYYIEASRSGDLNTLQLIMDQLLLKFDPSELDEIRPLHTWYSRDFKLALEINMADTSSSFWTIGDLLQRTGEIEQAQAYFDSARMDAEQAIQENPEDWEAYGELGITLAKQGRFEEAMDWGKREVELMPLSRDGLLGADALMDLADIYVICGEQDEAISLLEKLLTVPGWTSVNLLRLDPIYDPLRENPRFQTLVEQHDKP